MPEPLRYDEAVEVLARVDVLFDNEDHDQHLWPYPTTERQDNLRNKYRKLLDAINYRETLANLARANTAAADFEERYECAVEGAVEARGAPPQGAPPCGQPLE